ncbi:hypothetical protein DVH26_23790 [Paenibacillus sp. H1-7]|uniref:peptidase inhibitor family I36 protein n=1 Tax=Paenibacillus sp. H1-7 TaxID=2282849 RepID=UPI001EF92096|nr:peptidase inhibitor family I36 protein [Paenibacillus sp. H1-7]ULL17195.1 hypothetical protein DVH26_23790 [Paenibacillus sp. H1-7]
MLNRGLMLSLFSGTNFTGRRIRINRGSVAIKDFRAFQFNDQLSSFQLRNVIIPSQVTLVLFRDINFQGTFRVFRGSQNVANLGSFDNLTSSLILVGRNLSIFEIGLIQSTGKPPRGVVVIKQ